MFLFRYKIQIIGALIFYTLNSGVLWSISESVHADQFPPQFIDCRLEYVIDGDTLIARADYQTEIAFDRR